MKISKKFLYLAIPILMSACGHNEKHDAAFEGYIYPYDSLVNPKVFIYRRSDTVDTYSYRFKQVITENGRRFLLATSLDEKAFRDSSKSLIVGENMEPVDLFVYSKGKDGKSTLMVKGEIREFKNSDKYKMIDAIYKNPINESSSQVKYESTFNSFIRMQLRNKQYDCALYDDYYKFKIKFKKIPIFSKSYKVHYKSVLAKGLGMIQYSFDDSKSDRSFVWELDTIMDYGKFKENQK